MENRIYEQVGKTIKRLREEYNSGQGLRQDELASQIGAPQNTISRWENATYKPRISDLEKLARFFSVPIYTFLPVELHPDKPELNALFSAVSDLKPEDINELTKFALFRKTRTVLNKHKAKRK